VEHKKHKKNEQLYPKHRIKKDKSNRKWRIEYDLAYDGGGEEWVGYYRTRLGAKISAFWNVHVSSWGGSAILINNEDI